MNTSSNAAYLTISVMFGLFVMGALFLFGNTAGEDITRAIETGDTSYIQVEKYVNPSTYGKEVNKMVDTHNSNNADSEAGSAKSRFN